MHPEEFREMAALRFSREKGLHAVVRGSALSPPSAAGTFDVCVMMDGDLQDPPELIPTLVVTWREGWDVVYAVKRSRQESWPVRLVVRAFRAILHRMADVNVPIGAGNLSLLSGRVVQALRAMPERARYLSGLRAWVGFPQTGVEFDRDERYDHRPRMPLGRLLRLACDAIFGFSRMPLRAALYLVREELGTGRDGEP